MLSRNECKAAAMQLLTRCTPPGVLTVLISQSIALHITVCRGRGANMVLASATFGRMVLEILHVRVLVQGAPCPRFTDQFS